MDMKYNYLVDEHLKIAYMETLTDMNEDSSLTIKSRLKTLDTYEYQINKSLLDWTSSEIEDFLRFLNSKSRQSLFNIFTSIKDYAAFCEIERQKNEPSSVLSNFFADESLFDAVSLNKFINTKKQDESIISQKEYLDAIQNKNIPDFGKMVLLILWHGLNFDKINEIFLLDKKLIDTNRRRILNRSDVWEPLEEAETELISRFYEVQTIPEEFFDGEMRAIVETGGQNSYYLCELQSNRIFHRPVAFAKPARASNKMMHCANKQGEFTFNNGTPRRVWKELATAIEKVNMRPKDVVKSGCYHRMIRDLEVTDDILEVNEVYKVYREYAADYMKLASIDELKLAYRKAKNI